MICPACGRVYSDWWRPSINLDLDDFDDAHLAEATITRAMARVWDASSKRPMINAF